MIKHFLMRALRNSVIFGCILLFFSTPLKPILDGRTTPIYVENTYTFTDGEWARGWVYFKNGIEVPAGLTAHLAVIPPVNGLNTNGTGQVILEDNLYLVPSSTPGSTGYFNGGYFSANFDQATVHFLAPCILTSGITIQGSNDIIFNLNGHDFAIGVAGFHPILPVSDSFDNALGFRVANGRQLYIMNGSIVEAYDTIYGSFLRTANPGTGAFSFGENVIIYLYDSMLPASLSAGTISITGNLTILPSRKGTPFTFFVYDTTFETIGTASLTIGTDITLTYTSSVNHQINNFLKFTNGNWFISDTSSVKIIQSRVEIEGISMWSSSGLGSSLAIAFQGSPNMRILPGSSLILDSINVRHDS